MPAQITASPAFLRNWRKRSRPRSATRKPPRPSRGHARVHRSGPDQIVAARGLIRLLARPGPIFRMGTADEYIHEPPSAFWPIWTGGNAGNTEQSPEQVEGLKIRPDVTVGDSPLHQRINRSANRST